MDNKKKLGRLALILWALVLLWVLPLVIQRGYSQYTDTTTVDTMVNITNAAPEVYNVVIPPQISLIAYDTKEVQCNLTTYDYDNDEIRVNASLFYYTTSSIADPNQNTIYYNTSCSNVSSQDYEINWTCNFHVNYFANNGSWYCNATAIDTKDAVGTNQSEPGIINSLVAIKTTDLMDFGYLGVNEVSNDTTANITNVGNRNINITVAGYAQTPGDGYAMNCTSGFIPVSYKRYNVTNESDYSLMPQLQSDSVQIEYNFFVPQRTSETEESVNSTYWKISIPPGAGGFCTGHIVFAAIDRGE